MICCARTLKTSRKRHLELRGANDGARIYYLREFTYDLDGKVETVKIGGVVYADPVYASSQLLQSVAYLNGTQLSGLTRNGAGAMGMDHSGMQQGEAPVAANAHLVPGYPQDMWMVMDDMFVKPETWGLRKGWTGGTMGMMTLVRVLKPEVFDRIQKMKAEQASRRRS